MPNVTDYEKEVLKIVSGTANDAPGLRKIVETAEQAIMEIDNDIAVLQSQRSNLANIYNHFNHVHKIMTGAEFRTRTEQMKVTATSFNSPQREADVARRAVLRTARELWEEDEDEVSDQNILDALISNEVSIPWKNPKAVIGTILTRSGFWDRPEPGSYSRKEGTEQQEED